MKIKKHLLFLIVFMIGLTGVNAIYVMGGENSAENGGVSLSPAYVDLGIIKENPESFRVTVMNKGKAVRLKAKVDNADSAQITVSPDTFDLAENEQKIITVGLNNVDKLKIGVYDLSISYVSETVNQDSVTAFGTNSVRLVFRKEGLALATCNVKDISPVQTIPFHSILCNFYMESKAVDVGINIMKKDTGKLIWQQEDLITMESYPMTGYYGKIATPLLSEPWEYGDYIYCLTARQGENTLLEYQKEFNVGEQKGKLEAVTTRDVRKGEPAEFKARIKNIGTQTLPVTVQIYVKDKKNQPVYDSVKSDTLPIDNTKDFIFEWPTQYTKTGRYTIDYTVTMGSQQEAGTLEYKVSLPGYVYWVIIGIILLLVLIVLFVIMTGWYRWYLICKCIRNCMPVRRIRRR